MRGALFRLLLAVLACVSGIARGADLAAYTEEWAPYNFTENGAVRGISTDILRAACSAAALRCDIAAVPWARAYALAQTTPGTVAYTTARKPEREHLFRWIGPILPRATWVFLRRETAGQVSTFADLNRYRIGVVRGEATISDLQAKGVRDDALFVENSNLDILKQLDRGHLDGMVDTEIGMAWQLAKANLPADSLVKVLKLSDEGAYYFALNPRTNPNVARRLQQAVDKLRRSGAIDQIVAEYTHP